MKSLPPSLTHRGAAVIKHDYLQEIGIDSVEKKVSWPSAIAIIAIFSIMAVVFVAWDMARSIEMDHATALTHTTVNSATHLSGAARATSGTTEHSIAS
jgi:hypothetical protein